MANVLILDNDHRLRATLRGLLEDAGHDVTAVGDGLAGLAMLYVSPAPFVVLLDAHLQEVEPQDLLLDMREDELIARHAFVLLASGPRATFSPELLYLHTSRSLPLLRKPYDVQAVLETVEQAARRLPAVTPEARSLPRGGGAVAHAATRVPER
jgi:CheY-like chemotaxis protein